jgi:hypothetical protein
MGVSFCVYFKKLNRYTGHNTTGHEEAEMEVSHDYFFVTVARTRTSQLCFSIRLMVNF